MSTPPETPSTCPKCGHRPPATTEACSRCGLVFARWDAATGQAVTPLDEAGEALWTAVQGGWSESDRHDAFLKHCAQASLLPAAGRRYRERLDQQPSDPLAAQMQVRILAMATATFVRPSAVPPPVTRSTWFWVLILVCGLVGTGAALLFHH
jgi:hypothetical protein